ncbi:MAG: sugar phosphate isomerase/epimerase [Clostridia bacterium]|nr:sugar phosphate isomerase/epimerase [Clostridia bacterium]
MKIGISTASLCKRAETEDALSLLKELGAETCEVYLGTFYEYRPEFAKKFAERAAGVEVNSVHANPLNFEPQLFFRSRRDRGDGFYWLDQILRSAQIFGAKNYTFHGSLRKGGEKDDFSYIAERLREVADFCARYGVNLCLENVRWGLYNRPSVFTELKQRCSQLSGVFDIKQARKSGYPYQMYIKDMAGAISQVHISDADENGKTCLPGQGGYDFKEVFARLKDAGFDGSVLIKCENFQETDELKRAADFLKEVIYNIR